MEGVAAAEGVGLRDLILIPQAEMVPVLVQGPSATPVSWSNQEPRSYTKILNVH